MKLFTRTTSVFTTPEGLQQSRIQVYLYEFEEIAFEYYKEWVEEEDWKKGLENGHLFFSYNDKEDNTIVVFLEMRLTNV